MVGSPLMCPGWLVVPWLYARLLHVPPLPALIGWIVVPKLVSLPVLPSLLDSLPLT